MMRRRITLACLLALCLLFSAGVSGAAEDLSGRWSGPVESGTGTLFLGENGSLLMLYEENGDVEVDIGRWTLQPGSLQLSLADGSTLRFQYMLQGESLSVREEGTNEWQTLNRGGPWAPPQGLAGAWEGKDVNGAFQLTLSPDNAFSLDYLSGEAMGAGSFAEYQGSLYLVFSNNTYLIMGYSLDGDQMTIKNQFTGEPFPMTRRQVPLPEPDWLTTPAPAPATEGPVPEWLTTSAPAPGTEEPEPEWLTTPAPAPGTEEPEPEWLTTPAPAPATEGPVPDWLTTPAPATEEPLPAPSREPPAPAPGLEGRWQAGDAGGTRTLLITPEGGFEITLEQAGAAAVTKAGTCTFDGDHIQVNYGDGTAETFRYILLGDRLLLTDANLQNPVTYARAAEPEMDPALAGTWAGYDPNNTYAEATFGADGTFTLRIPSDESKNVAGRAATRQGMLRLSSDELGEEEFSYTVREDTLTLDGTQQLRRMKGPLVRDPFPADAPSAGVDSALCGTWGGHEGQAYLEYSFFPDGKFRRFCPYDESLNLEGNYIAGGGSLAVLTLQGSSQGTYEVNGKELTLTLAGGETLRLSGKDGVLRRAE